MKHLVWFLLGIAGGFAAAHFMNKDPRGQEILADVDARISEFTDRIADAYHQQEARFAEAVDDLRGAATGSAVLADDAASDAVEPAADVRTLTD